MSHSGRTPIRVGLLGMYASANLGDTAIQQAVMQALLARRADIEYVGLCTDPQDAARTFGIRARHLSGAGAMVAVDANGAATLASPLPTIDLDRLPAPLRLGMSAWRIGRQMRELDMLLVSGSGQVDDFWGGPWEQPFRLMSWCGAARRQGKPVAVFGVGVDQLLTRLGAMFSTRALGRAHLRVLRDGGSLDALRALGMHAATEVCPDPAFHLVSPVPRGAASEGAPFAVISPIARQAWPGAELKHYEAYLDALAAVGDSFQHQGIEVRFVCSQTRMDPPVVPRVIERMRSSVDAAQVRTTKTVDDYLREVAPARLVVGSRLHAMILALVAGTPVVAISYARKVQRQLQDAQLSDYVLDLRDINVPELLSTANRALSAEARLRSQIEATTADFRRQLDVQFDRLAALIPRSTAL